ncbi:hypothetical protein C3486_35525 [Streptomyces sp. Ru73]|nr:hypothetical protein C3486_35525 [Streptomyces sp. Ru73]
MPYSGDSAAPYSGDPAAPYPGDSSVPYSGDSAAPHSGGPVAPYPGDSSAPYSGGPAASDGDPAAPDDERVIRLPTGYTLHPWADLQPAGERAATGRKLWHASPGSAG